MISTNDVKPGMALSLENKLFTIVEYQHVKPGKGKAFVRMKLKNVETGQVIDRTFRAGEDLDRAIIDRKEHQFLYRDDMGFHFMDLEEFSQFALAPEDVGDAGTYPGRGCDGGAAALRVPAHRRRDTRLGRVGSHVCRTGRKGDRVSGATKPVTVQTGRTVDVPLFIEIGDVIKVDTRSGDYMTRV